MAHLLPSAVLAGSPKCGGVVLNCGKAGTLRLSSDLLTPTSVSVEASSPDVPSASPGDGTAGCLGGWGETHGHPGRAALRPPSPKVEGDSSSRTARV